jgi:hypothetical protein
MRSLRGMGGLEGGEELEGLFVYGRMRYLGFISIGRRRFLG